MCQHFLKNMYAVETCRSQSIPLEREMCVHVFICSNSIPFSYFCIQFMPLLWPMERHFSCKTRMTSMFILCIYHANSLLVVCILIFIAQVDLRNFVNPKSNIMKFLGFYAIFDVSHLLHQHVRISIQKMVCM